SDPLVAARNWFDKLDPSLDRSIRDDLLHVALEGDGGFRLANELPARISPEEAAPPGDGTPQRLWELMGILFMNQGRLFKAIEILEVLYMQRLKSELQVGSRAHKAMPLVWISECFAGLGYLVHAKRYLMYTLCEDAAKYGPNKRANESGVYFRARRYGMSD